ncbi:DUF1573 domain-containing protein [Marinigracilibium pacificum]|uniref:DUF1573 domain-containing protein n=1 Tax=Marinigracilibium pacificum TaxID=2729599 RepID=A0A848IUG9_9BACT|nr:DUF1573 domain-containing protein [Marinigracilibium pacificum]NMM46861.1 DUF1573 domain-containing protein [Marinigracilibium pacificum]
MKKLSLLALVALVFASCTNDKLEKRVEDLENRVAQLEQTGQVSSTTPVAQSIPTANASAQPQVDPNAPLPAFEFDNNTYEFGDITEGDVVEHVFKFKNTGESELLISNVQASCGCTTPEWTKEPVAVGEEGEIHVRFDSKNKVGRQNKSVTITANTNPARTVLYIKGNVASADGKSSILK